MSSKRKKIFIALSVLSILFSFGLGMTVGTTLDIYKTVTNSQGTVDVKKVVDLYQKTRSEEVSFDQFWRVWDMVQEGYVDQPVSDVELYYGAIKGMVEGLDDPYSVYLPPAKAEEFVNDLSGEFEGIGAEIGIRDDILTVIAPLPGSPAEQAGLRPGDKIFAIDGEDTTGITTEEAVTKIRGEKGTTVKLTVTSSGLDTVKDVEVTRDTINVPTVTWEQKEDGIAYMRLSYFNEDTVPQFEKSVKEMLVTSPKGLILDLRSNPGGYLDSAVRVSSEWITSGAIVREKFQDDHVKVHESRGTHKLANMPTVVLVDEGTASGSEILAGALQDYGKATLVGHKTFGKGSVQNFEVLPDGSALKLTIAKWYTPKDRGIDKEGITPDMVIEGDLYVEDETAEDGFRDVGLERAMEEMRKLVK